MPFSPLFGPTKIDYRKKQKVGTRILTSLLEDLGTETNPGLDRKFLEISPDTVGFSLLSAEASR